MDSGFLIKPFIGALVVIVIQILSKTKNYYIAALVPLFPFFSLMSYYVIGTTRNPGILENTIIFGMFSLIPYFMFLLTLYFSVKHFKIQASLIIASFAWAAAAAILLVVWNRLVAGR